MVVQYLYNFHENLIALVCSLKTKRWTDYHRKCTQNNTVAEIRESKNIQKNFSHKITGQKFKQIEKL